MEKKIKLAHEINVSFWHFCLDRLPNLFIWANGKDIKCADEYVQCILSTIQLLSP